MGVTELELRYDALPSYCVELRYTYDGTAGVNQERDGSTGKAIRQKAANKDACRHTWFRNVSHKNTSQKRLSVT